jgi:hypothetical protein
MSGLGTVEWDPGVWQQYERALFDAGYAVDHCAHCDRSERHPSCMIVPIPGREQKAMPSIPEQFRTY